MKHLEVHAKKLGIQISVYCNPKNHATIYHFTSFNFAQNDTRSDHFSLLEAGTDRVVFFFTVRLCSNIPILPISLIFFFTVYLF